MSKFQFLNFNYDIKNNQIPNNLLELADNIYNEYIKKNIISRKRKDILKKYFYLNRILIINLYNTYQLNQVINYSRGYYFYNTVKKYTIKYNHDLCNYKSIIKLIDLYHDNNLVIKKNGYNVENKPHLNSLSKIYSTKLLNHKFDTVEDIEYIQSQYTTNLSDDYIIVRKKHKKDKFNHKILGDKIYNIDELQSPNESINNLKERIKKIKNRLYMINNKSLNSEFKIYNIEDRILHYREAFNYHCIDKYENYYKLSPKLFLNKRIFNNASLIYGGRLYNYFQLFKTKDRQYLIINNEKIKSLDISGSHIRMLYHLSNKDILTDDIYDIRHSNDKCFNKFLRKITKKIILILLNSKNKYYIHKLISDNIIQQFQKIYDVTEDEIHNSGYLDKQFIDDWVNDIINSFKEIKQYFFTGVGLRLQYIEGELLQDVIYNLIVDYDILTIPIHDEILISENYTDYGIEYINNKYKKFNIFNNYFPTLKVK